MGAGGVVTQLGEEGYLPPPPEEERGSV